VKILILGGDGMLGHQLLKHFSRNHEARVTVHQPLETYAQFGLFNRSNTFDEIDARKFERVSAVAARFRPDAIVNAVGIVKQRAEAAEAIPSIEINALFPHRLAAWCRDHTVRMVHMSTDCVFSGRAGNYKETDAADPDDLYGRSKLLGEVSAAPCLTLRTSIFGPELLRKVGLFEWLLARQERIRGFRRAVYSGFTTAEMARIIERLLTGFPDAAGLYHVSSAPINKYELLELVNRKLGLGKEIVPDDAVVYDRSLDSTRFRRDFGYTPPSWEAMTEELAENWRQETAGSGKSSA